MNIVERSDGFGVTEISAQGQIQMMRVGHGRYLLTVGDGDGIHHFEISAQSGRIVIMKHIRTEAVVLPWERDDARTSGLVQCLSGFEHMTKEIVATWTDAQCKAADRYVDSVTGDDGHDEREMPQPEFLDKYDHYKKIER